MEYITRSVLAELYAGPEHPIHEDSKYKHADTWEFYSNENYQMIKAHKSEIYLHSLS